jgi:hypothetical protein
MGLGDPHIVTLDGVMWTFNGFGEFFLIRTKVDNAEFRLQGRMGPPIGLSTAKATVYLAFAMMAKDTHPVEVSGFLVIMPPIIKCRGHYVTAYCVGGIGVRKHLGSFNYKSNTSVD